MATAAGRTAGRWWWSVTMTSMPRSWAAATSATLVVPVSTVMISVIPASAAAATAASESPWPSSSRDGTYGVAWMPEPAQREHQLGEPGESVGIKVAEHHHALPGVAGRAHALRAAARIGEEARVVEPGDGGPEEGRERRRAGDAPPRQHRRGKRPDAMLARRPRAAPDPAGAAPRRPSDGVRRSSCGGCHGRLRPRVGGAVDAAPMPAPEVVRAPGAPGPGITWSRGGPGGPRVASAPLVLPLVPDDEQRARVEDRGVGPRDDARAAGPARRCRSRRRRTGAARAA